MMNRRTFLKTAAAAAPAAWLMNYKAMAATMKGKVKVRDIQTMMLQGPRTYTLVKVVSDQGPFGIAEAYGSPGVGVREQVDFLKTMIVGKDPLEIEEIVKGGELGG